MKHYDCDICKFYHPNPDNGNVGECHREPPVPKLTSEGRHCELELAVWPRVTCYDWCDRFELNAGPKYRQFMNRESQVTV